MLPKKQPSKSASCSASLTVPELDQSKTTVLNTLASAHSRRSYKHAIEKFIAWYCAEPRLGFNRSVVVRYRSALEDLSVSAATVLFLIAQTNALADDLTGCWVGQVNKETTYLYFRSNSSCTFNQQENCEVSGILEAPAAPPSSVPRGHDNVLYHSLPE